jgi:uracil-DNA glycosylase
MKRGDARSDLGAIAASLRAYLEWHQDAGTEGFPRGGRATAGAHRGEETDAVRPTAITTTTASTATAATLATTASATAKTTASAGATTTSSADERVDRHVRLPRLASEVASCTRCSLGASRTQTVFARGNPEAALCFVGEAPGAEEDAQGLPFVGRAGQLLDQMIGAMGLTPARDAYICNILKCRPPGNRRPEPEEIATCIPYLHEQLALVRPHVIVALGNTAAATLLDTKVGISKIRGEWKLYRGHTLVLPTYHPSYLLRPSPQQIEAKRQAWQDLQLVMKELKLPPAGTRSEATPPGRR